ncbi:MAG: GTP-binding protein [Pseudomonadales bacterium]|nr:GTP-binding protein [Pseudomonadales bacterium]
MNADEQPISQVPSVIITGFLGVGKTSAILNLLKQKPENERWAVLVNEFGEIGVDGSLFEGQSNSAQEVFIREVPGGCMCCSAGLPMQVALNQLLSKARPDRLLIEPTGLGHPMEVLEVLSGDQFRDALNLQKVLTLVDARKLSDKRYTEHETFNQQIAIADVVVGNKLDLYNPDDKDTLEAYIKDHGKADAEVIFTENGELPLDALQGHTTATSHHQHHHHHHSAEPKPLVSELPIPECGYIMANNQGEGFYSVGWRLAATKIFDYDSLTQLLKTIHAERMKAVFITNKGQFGYNLTTDALTEEPLQECKESRIEVISRQPGEVLEAQLLSCLA